MRRKASRIRHNCPAIHAALHQDDCEGHDDLLGFEVSFDEFGGRSFDTKEEAQYPEGLCLAYAGAVKHAMRAISSGSLPIAPSMRPDWIVQELQSSTKRLAAGAAGVAVAEGLCNMLSKMEPGGEADHLRTLLKFANHRGSEIRVSLASGSDEGQIFPYPSFAWQWETVQSYCWQHEQHINILEFTAFLNYLRSLSNKQHLQSLRLFHVFDSKVVCGALGKGRSPSKRVNRVCRRLLPMLLGMDWYIQTLWTVSRWQFSDGASRVWDNDEVH